MLGIQKTLTVFFQEDLPISHASLNGGALGPGDETSRKIGL